MIVNTHLTTLNQALNTINWQSANLRLVTKILAEFLYEEMLVTDTTTDANGQTIHTLQISPALYYTFAAQPRIFGNWHVNPKSIERWEHGQQSSSVSVSQLITDTYSLIGIKGLTLGHLIRELNNTLVADCHIANNTTANTVELLQLNNHDLEGYMHGHPWFVINKGRLGFSYPDYLQHAPEMRNQTSLHWIAAHKQFAVYHAIETVNYEQLIQQELSHTDQDAFKAILRHKQLSADDYYFMPIHIWQWHNQIVTLFADDIVHNNIVYLGSSSDQYVPTQSIRTFSNKSNSHKYQVKLPLSIFNTAVYRGLPGERTQLAPLLTSWLKKKYQDDTFLQNHCRLILLGEVASIDYAHQTYKDLPNIPYQYKELLGVIWRESVTTYLQPDEKAITMAALIHHDQHQTPFICELIKKSDLSIQTWLATFFSATIPPLLHWLYQYGLVFSPHGENTILILDAQYHPKGLVIKDFIDDVNLSDRDLPELDDLPLPLKQVLLKVSDHKITQFIHTGLFVVLYRYLSDILQTYADYDEADFWQQVHDVIKNYQASHPELQDRFTQFDLLRDSFNKMCLNRIRLLSVGYADYDDRPKVDTIGLMKNPANAQNIDAWRKKIG